MLKFLVRFLVICFIPIKTNVRQITFIILFKKERKKNDKYSYKIFRGEMNHNLQLKSLILLFQTSGIAAEIHIPQGNPL